MDRCLEDKHDWFEDTVQTQDPHGDREFKFCQVCGLGYCSDNQSTYSTTWGEYQRYLAEKIKDDKYQNKLDKACRKENLKGMKIGMEK